MTFFSAWFKRRRARLRATIRGYASLKRSGNLGLVRRIRNDLADCRLEIASGDIAARIFGAASTHAEPSVRQYLLERLLGPAFNRELMYGLGQGTSLSYPMPRKWRSTLVAHGVRVSEPVSAMRWLGYLGKHFMRGLYVFVDTITQSIIQRRRSTSSTPSGQYAYFSGLGASNLPTPGADVSHDICSWYARWEERPSAVQGICHDAVADETSVAGLTVRTLPAPYYLLHTPAEIAKISLFGTVVIARAVFDFLRGRWWSMVMLAEAIKATAVRLCPRERLATEYLFHYSGTIYRPLWTYEAEAKGSRIICYFYSTYEQPRMPGRDYESQRGDWGPATWPLYLVWDRDQDEQLRRDIPAAFGTLITGPIPFSAGGSQVPVIPRKAVAVFDVEVHRLSYHLPFSTLGEYFVENPDFSERFLGDIQRVMAELGVTVAFKKKRESGSRSRKSYRRLVGELSVCSNFLVIPPEVAAIQLIKECAAVISLPFTSTAHYLREQHIPSVYYDPTGWIQRDDRAAHGVAILIGIDELRSWARRVFEQ